MKGEFSYQHKEDIYIYNHLILPMMVQLYFKIQEIHLWAQSLD